MGSMGDKWAYERKLQTVLEVFCHLLLIPSHHACLFFLAILEYLCLRGENGWDLLEPLVNGDYSGRSCERNHDEELSLYSNANFFSLLSFSWIGPLLSVGSRKRLNLDDIPKLANHDSACHGFNVFSHNLQLDRSSSSSSRIGTLKLSKALFLSVWREVLLSVLFALCFTCASFVGPYLLDAFVQYLEARREASVTGSVLVFVFLFAKLIECLSQRHWFFQTQKFGMKSQAALVAMIYKKGLTISNRSRQGGGGEIVNLMSVDAERIGDFSWYMIDLCLIPFQVGLSLVILYKNLGLASLVTLAATLLVMVLNLPFSKLEQVFQGKIMEWRDKRIKATSEILRNMRILKFHGWEMRFLSKILEIRKNEMIWLKKYLFTEVLVTFVYWGAPIFVSVATFATCLLMGIPLESGKILSALATFNMLKDPIYNLPDTVSLLAQTLVSVDRISAFLSLEEWQPDTVEKLPRGSSDVAVEISDCNFSWEPLSSNCTLKNLNLRIPCGTKVAVCGTVGSGKSSLLCCMIGEIPKTSGTIKLCGNVAYVAQSPWIQSGTVESNILFGMEMSREKYEQILEACSLKKDLEILPLGDQTIIGERGINLSGGQKQRLQIARAFYRDADIYLFDDPFSAVDAHTGNHIFKECILECLGPKTVIYVTHQVEFLSNADLILVMEDGRINQVGRYSDIVNVEADLMALVKAHMNSLSAVNPFNELQPDDSKAVNDLSSQHLVECDSYNAVKVEDKYDEMNASLTGQLIQEEERESGNVGLSVYWRYITALHKGALVPFILLAYILFQILQICSNYWMATAAPVTKNTSSPVDGSTLILVYVLLALGSSLCVLLRVSLLVTAGFNTAKLLFDNLHRCIFRAPMSFFDATPSGRILNRASTDQSAIDESIPVNLGLFASVTIQFLGILAVMSQVAWQVFVIFVPVIAISVWYQQYYIANARELTRLVGVRNAPIIQHFAESISGLTTIRSFNEESRFSATCTHLIDAYLQPQFHNAGVREWLCFRLDILSSSVFAFSLAFFILIPPWAINPGVAGLAVTYGLSLSSLLALVVWNICNLENKMISAERIFQYTCIPSEHPLVLEANRPPDNWPFCGEINIRDLLIRYAPHLPLVLRGITCRFPGGTKTGIVGRTGSGKSALIQALFRIFEPTSGEIVIDGIDISTIGLLDLRSRLSIIPQEPTMFEGTVRNNLDPLEEYTDEQIWAALDKCQLEEEIWKKDEKLDSPVVEHGENWGVGQRQLVCMGRVLLRKSKILVLDEATASVDTATDVLIQRTLRTRFSEATIITIVHRIASVLDSDNVLLLDNGRIIEYGSPSTLLQYESSAFAKLVKAYTSSSSQEWSQSIDHAI